MSAVQSQYDALEKSLKALDQMMCNENLYVLEAPSESTIGSQKTESFQQRLLTSAGWSMPMDSAQTVTLTQPKKGKKNKKKKKKEKVTDRFNESVLSLRQILQAIYFQTQTFDIHGTNLAELYEGLRQSKKFYELLNDIIKDIIEEFREDIWEVVDDRIMKEPYADCRSKDYRSGWPNFYIFFIDVMHQKLLNIKAASKHVQKLIIYHGLFYEIRNSQEAHSQKNIELDLFRNTFIYMVNSDRLIKRFMKCGQKFFSSQMQISQEMRETYRKMKEMLAVLRPIDSQDEDDDFEYDNTYDGDMDETSTAESSCLEEVSKKKRKKKKKKQGQSYPEANPRTHSMNCRCGDEQSHDKQLVDWLSSLTIPSQRVKTQFDPSQMNEYLARLHKYDKQANE